MSVCAPFPTLKRPLVAILRGVEPQEAEAIVGALLEEGFRAIEIPLNSPDPFRSIEAAVRLAPADAWIGAGTVLDAGDVDRLAGIGARLVVSPNVDVTVIERAAQYAMVSMPGVFTASEALLAVRAGASALKFFPASVLGPAGIAAIGAVLPRGTVVGAVGGVSDGDFARYLAAGIKAFGLGSSLYKPGMPAGEVAARARTTIASYEEALRTRRP